MLKKHILSKYGSTYNLQEVEMFPINVNGITTYETSTVEISDTDEKIVSGTKETRNIENSDADMVFGSTELTKSIELSDADEIVESEKHLYRASKGTSLTETIEVSDQDEYVCGEKTQTTFVVETSDADEFYS